MKKRALDLGTVGGLFLICVFAVCLFFTLAAGAMIYKDVSGVMEERYTVRTAVSYLAARVHQGNAGEIYTGKLDDCDALVIPDSDGEYLTYIYCWNGYIRELYCPAGETLSASDGETIIPADSVEFSLSGGLLKIGCSTDGGSAVQYVGVTQREGAGT